MRLALFDLDGTLLAHDTQLLFCNHVLRRRPLRRCILPAAATLAVPSAVLRVLETRELKRLFLSYLWMMPRLELETHAREFAGTVAASLIHPDLAAEIERHRRDRRVLVLNSASPEFYVREIGRQLGFDHAFGTKVLVEDRQPLVPEIDGPNNKLEAKIGRLSDAGLLPCDPDDSWAYSDSAADLPMLRLVRHVVCVNPNPRLLAEAESRGWPVRRPARPWSGPAGRSLVVLRQLLGAWPENRA
jgi:HAD superfamily hydrolase (TIGR01490 family)